MGPAARVVQVFAVEIREIRKSEVTVLLVEQDAHMALDISDRA